MADFFTADTHFDHTNIIKYCERPYKNAQEMNQAYICAWNSVVSPKDTVFHLGDFAFVRQDERLRELRFQLNGNIILILGNHDDTRMIRRNSDLFKRVAVRYNYKCDGKLIVLDHFALRVWDKSFHGSYHLYGHSHGTLTQNGTRSFDIGVDVHGRPLSFREVMDIMSKLEKK